MTQELTAEAPEERKAGLITALQNGLEVLDMFDTDRSVITVAEIGRHLDVHKSTASRIASTLVAVGYLRPAARRGGFQLGAKLTRLGELAATDASIATVALPVIESLVEEVGETCHLGVLEGTEAVTVALVDGRYSVRMHSHVGKRSPANCTAMGKILLAGLHRETLEQLYPSEGLPIATERSIHSKTELFEELTTIRLAGHAIDDEELEVGLRCVAAPVRDHTGDVAASLTIAGSASRINDDTLDDFIETVRRSADQISLALGAPPIVSR